MEIDDSTSQSARDYALAYEAQYAHGDLQAALVRYLALIANHPGADEATFARTQILNIVRNVVPRDELFDTQVRLAMAHIQSPAAP